MTPPRPPGRRRRRALDAEERALWDHVVRSVQPLRPRPLPEQGPAAAPPPEPPAPAKPLKPARLPAAAVPKPPPLAALEPKARRRLVRGAEVDARIDLHGLTQAAAHQRLRMFLAQAQAAGHSVVLVITGKGDPAGLEAGGSAFGEGRGVLRRAVPLWLAQADLRALVVGFEPAGRRHGGDGALYVRIRRGRA